MARLLPRRADHGETVGGELLALLVRVDELGGDEDELPALPVLLLHVQDLPADRHLVVLVDALEELELLAAANPAQLPDVRDLGDPDEGREAVLSELLRAL